MKAYSCRNIISIKKETEIKHQIGKLELRNYTTITLIAIIKLS